MKIIIDGEDAILGRLSTYIVKQLLLGNDVIVLNSEKVIITGDKNGIINRYKKLVGLGGRAQKGPFYPKRPFMMLKRAVRGMLPEHRWGTGRAALKKLICHDGVPTEFEGQKTMKIKTSKPERYITLKELAEKL
jgi:large subunit ribosomal protein L13